MQPGNLQCHFRSLLAQRVRMTKKQNNTPSSFQRKLESTRVSGNNNQSFTLSFPLARECIA